MSLRSKITRKIGDYRRRDKVLSAKYPIINEGLTTITSDEGIEIVNKYGKLCPGCGCEMLFKDYAPWCLYQFTFDKINDNIIHCKSNLKISCYMCNCSGYGTPKYSCKKLCHTSDVSRHKHSGFISAYKKIRESLKPKFRYNTIVTFISKKKIIKRCVLI
jgi:hypothetical protein